MKITQRDKLFVILIISILCFWCEYKVVLSPIQKNIAELNKKNIHNVANAFHFSTVEKILTQVMS